MGIWCAHSYPHASEDVPLDELLPRGLKGSDLMFYAIFKSLGIDPKVLPIFMINRYPDVNSPKKDYSVFVAEGLMPCWIHDSGVDSHLPVASQVRSFNLFCPRMSLIFSIYLRAYSPT